MHLTINAQRQPLGLFFTLLLVSSLGAAPSSEVLSPKDHHRPAFQLSAEQLNRLNRALAPYHQKYDPQEHMLKEPFHSPGYHTALKGGYTHGTRPSLHYAVALLDTGDPVMLQRAEAILRKVVSLQDKNPASKTYGIWSWFLEEPLDKMSPPDWNWADFCGVALLQVALDHRQRIAPDLAREIDAAIQHAARSIKKRNVGPGYTNIAIMGSYVTLVAGELYDWQEMKEYGLARWRQFYRHTLDQGAFNEYNSPTYTIVALEELGRLRLHVQDPEARRLAEELYELTWQEIAMHFHAPTRQWAGPHSRSYGSLLSKNVLALIQRGTEGRVALGVDIPALNECRLPLPCPRKWESCFTDPLLARDLRQRFIRSEPPVMGTTWMGPDLALGSINCGDLWNQRRALIAYWGEAEHPAYLHLRFLHDGYDFADAQFVSVQQRDRVLAGIHFATDGGDTHVSLDKVKNATIRAKDLRLRFELGGAAGQKKPSAPERLDEVTQLNFDRIAWQIRIVHAAFATETLHWESGQQGGQAWLDLVLYCGEAKEFNFAQIQEAVIGLALQPARPKPSISAIQKSLVDGQLELSWDGLKLGFPTRPATIRDLRRRCFWEVP